MFSGFLHQVVNIGISDELTYISRREIKLLNSIAFGCIVLISIYAAVNLFVYPMLGIINVLTVIGIFLVFRFNHLRKYQLAKFWFLILLSVFFSVTNFIYPNSTEYYLLCLATVCLLLFKKNYIVVIIIVFVLLATIIPKFYPIESIIVKEVSELRIVLNSVLGLLCMLGIISYLKSIQADYQNQLSEQKNKLEESNRTMERLFAMLSHDIRSPLIGAKQAVEIILLKDLPQERQNRILENIKKQLTAMYTNIDGLLLWSKNNVQKIVPVPENINLVSCFSGLEDEFILQASTKNIIFRLQLTEEITVFADRQHLNLILRNLMANALKFSHCDSNIDIEARTTPNEIEIAVIDYGVGIPENKIGTLFKHIQEPAWGTAGEKGTGLGLTLIHDLVSLNNGSIRVTSERDDKTVFYVKLPKGN